MNPLQALLPLLLAALAAAQHETAFRIGTWNLEFLGAEGNFRNNLPPRSEADYAAIGRRVGELGVAVLAVQEINDAAALHKVARGAGPTWELVLGESGQWTDGKTAQRIGFLYDRAIVDLLFAEELRQLPRDFDGAPIFHRVPVTAAFRHRPTGADFRLVTVHLKAGRKAEDQHKRRGEALALAAWLDGLRADPAEDPDIVLLGDFNSTYGADPERILAQNQGFGYVDQREPTPTILHFPEPIDQIVVSTGCEELRRDSLAVVNDLGGLDRDAWRKIYSDHFPVVVTLVAAGDDDPNATFRRTPGAHQLLPYAPAHPPGAWPFAAGAEVRVQTATQSFSGRLRRDVCPDGSGWILLDIDGRTIAIACSQVTALEQR